MTDNLQGQSLENLSNENPNHSQQIGFRSYFNHGTVTPNVWINPNMTLFVPSFQAMTPLSSPPITPCLTSQESPSCNNDVWTINFMNSAFQNQQNRLFLGN
eukprot:TRINITY_DN79278_c0_g1_i1.p1 TRINITY_DN79278_c0_g1~~TRINITY_DN79278_c0_g1_i1.p1  ORF type:complete len:101 (-),score=6.02 TRINITY_DN79278_c0_g1_i1:17-319(-)